MSADAYVRGSAENDLITLDEPHERRGWANVFGITPSELVSLCRELETRSAKTVREHLANRKAVRA